MTTASSMLPPLPATAAVPRGFVWGCALLGVALSGFFDGILLHQVLRWHHLLSGVDDPALRDIDRQILADGLFHVLMYILAAFALWLCWRGRAGFSASRPGSRLLGLLLLGFGIWNVIDVAGFHWVLRIHRIRMDSPDPMFWDLLWLGIFGIVPLAPALWLLLRHERGASQDAGLPARRGRNTLAWAAIAVAITGAAYWDSRPPPGLPTLLVYYPPGTKGATIFRGLDAAQARIQWVNASGTLWALQLPDPLATDALYRNGAWYTNRSLPLAGCAAWLRSAATGART